MKRIGKINCILQEHQQNLKSETEMVMRTCEHCWTHRGQQLQPISVLLVLAAETVCKQKAGAVFGKGGIIRVWLQARL